MPRGKVTIRKVYYGDVDSQVLSKEVLEIIFRYVNQHASLWYTTPTPEPIDHGQPQTSWKHRR